MNADLISVVIPCYNNEQTISRAVLSVTNQSYKNIEIICIDDGSKDDTVQTLHQLNTSIKNMLILTNTQNKGPSYSRNRGVKKAKGKYIAFLDADDYWHPKKLEIQLQIAYETKWDLIGSLTKTNLDINKNPLPTNIQIKKITFNQLLFKNYFSTPSVLVKKNTLPKFDENQKYSEDYKLWLDILKVGGNSSGLVISAPPLVGLDKFTYGVSGLSANLWKMEKFELKNYWELFKEGYWLSLFAILFSLIKFLKRLCVVYLKNEYSSK